MIILFVLLSLAIGGVLYIRAMRNSPPILIDCKAVFIITLISIYAVSFLGIILIEFAILKLPYLLWSEVFLLLILIVEFSFTKTVPEILFNFKIGRIHIAMAVILIVGALLRFPPSNYMAGDQDQGLYVNIGNHIARTGGILIKDDLLNALAHQAELRDYYLRNNYLWTGAAVENQYEGAFLRGIYVKDLEQALLVPQFYHLQPVWFALSNILLGPERTTYPLFLFSILSIILIYFLAQNVFQNPLISLSSALLLAANPLHSFMSRFPVSEVMSGVFFLSGLFFLLESKNEHRHCLVLSLLSFGCMFFTRITGFLLLPVLLFYLLYIRVFEKSVVRRLNVLVYTVFLFGLYFWSLYHGMTFSFPYSHDIYKRNVGMANLDLTSGISMKLFFIGLMTVTALFALYHFIGRIQNEIRMAWHWLAGHRIAVISVLLSVIFALAFYRIYVLSYTNQLVNDSWLGQRWQMAGNGIGAVKRTNLVVLAKFLTPLGMLMFLAGVYVFLKRGFYTKRILLFGLFTLYYLSVYTIVRYTTPYLYYYARYLLSELLPLALAGTAFAVVYFSGFLNRRRRSLFTYSILLFLLVAPSLFYSLRQAQGTELDGFFEGVKAISNELEDRSILFIDSYEFPVSRLITPLRLTFNKQTFVYESKTITPEKLGEIFLYFEKQGYSIFAAATVKENMNYRFLKILGEFVVPFNKMRTSDRIPMKYRDHKLHVVLYRFESSALQE